MRSLAGAITCGAILLAMVLGTGTALANSPINEFSLTPSSTQAGGHPDIRTLIWMSNTSIQSHPPGDCECHDVRNITVDAPAGLIPDVFATPRCSSADFGQSQCPIDSQIGYVVVGIGGDNPNSISFPAPKPIYNLVPRPGQAGLIGFIEPLLNSAPIFTDVEGRTENDYGLEFTVNNINHVFGGVSVVEQVFWGVPADPANNPMRFKPVGCTVYGVNGAPECEGGAKSNAPLEPFISAPTICGVPLETESLVESYDHGFDRASGTFPGTTGCDQLSFNPSLFAQPTTTRTDTASGLDIDLKVPAAESPIAPSPSAIAAATVTLPKGFSINSSAADGKTSCSAEQARIGFRHGAAQCPEASKIGSLTITTSSLPAPLPGFVYLADPKPGDPYRIYLIADGFGVHVKLPAASVEADPVTGQLTARLEGLPQFPFNEFNLHLFGSERGLLATPDRCGTYPVESTFTPWDSDLPEQTSTQFFSLNEGPNGTPCPGATRGFDPTFRAGVSDRGAAVHSPFVLDATRPDGDQDAVGVNISTPPGFTASLKGIPYCPESAISQLRVASYSGRSEQGSPACPQASQVGTVEAGAGAGTHQVNVDGRVYLAGPYKGAPLSIVAVVPAVSGPYDLGNIVVRSAIRIDEETAQIHADTDRLPLIVEGIPLRTRHLRVNLDRPGFTLNPTNCNPLSVDAVLFGDEGAAVNRSSSFQAANCAGLKFGPALTLKLSGGVYRRGHPDIHAVLRAKPGEANSRTVSLTLPKGELLDNSHIDTICTRVNFAADNCPAGSRIGTVTADTPLLDQPLSGGVYLRASNHSLPDMVLDLRGQVHIVLDARIDTVKGRLRTTFAAVPDAPVSTVSLRLDGGKKGLLVNSEGLCGKGKKASLAMVGQNGMERDTSTKLRTTCGKGKGGK
jgi:hypothetical protein